jgi:hypothetical protein
VIDMKQLLFARKFGLVALASILMLGAQGLAFARAPGGGGFHGGGFGGFHGGGGFRGGGFRGGFHGGHGGAPFSRPGYGFGWGHGYGWGRGYGYGGGWGPAWGLGLGVYLSTLPWYYSTYWWDGVPYYYVDNNYYLWDSGTDAYEQVQPPPDVAQEAAEAPPTAPQLFAYPTKGQTAQQQATDKSECSQWATAKTGFVPDAATAKGDTPTEATKRQDYLRAEGACLEGRGYTVG